MKLRISVPCQDFQCHLAVFCVTDRLSCIPYNRYLANIFLQEIFLKLLCCAGIVLSSEDTAVNNKVGKPGHHGGSLVAKYSVLRRSWLNMGSCSWRWGNYSPNLSEIVQYNTCFWVLIVPPFTSRGSSLDRTLYDHPGSKPFTCINFFYSHNNPLRYVKLTSLHRCGN